MLKKRFLSLFLASALFLSATVAAYAVEDNSTKLEPPPELIILDGEEWIPNAPEPSLRTCGVDDDCRHNSGHPANYRYIGAVKGNTTADVKWVDGVVFGVGLALPTPFGTVLSVAVNLSKEIFPGDKLEGNYIRYQYVYNVGPDPNMYWFHTFYTFATVTGDPAGSQCHATYSPKKSTSDPYQD